MSQNLFLFIFLFLVGCTVNINPQIHEEIINETKSVINESSAESAVESIIPRDTNTTNIVASNKSNSVEKTIEVVAVAEDNSGCLLKVGGVLDMVMVGESKTVNGVKIKVLEAYALHSIDTSKDSCKFITG